MPGPATLYAPREEGITPGQEAGATLVVTNDGTGQFAGFHLREERALCRQMYYTTQVAGLSVCLIKEGQEADERHVFRTNMGDDIAWQQLLSHIGFLHISTNQEMQENLRVVMQNLRQVKMDTWQGKLHSLAGADNPYALLDMHSRG